MINKVAVIMPTYNGEKYITYQIESILNQKNVQFSLWVRDDGSTDNTRQILERYQNSGKLKWYTGEHLNVAYGFFDLLKNADDNEYYAFCDQDDIWDDNKLESAIKMLSEYSSEQPLLYYSSTRLVDNDLNLIYEHKINRRRTDAGRFFYIDSPGHTFVINKKLRDEILKNLPPGIEIHDRWAIQFCLAIGGKCIGDINSYVNYRQHDNNTVGMDTDLKKKIYKFKQISKRSEDKHFKLLNEYYSDMLVSPYKEIVKLTENQPFSLKERFKLIFNKEIKLGNKIFDIAFKLHVMKGHI